MQSKQVLKARRVWRSFVLVFRTCEERLWGWNTDLYTKMNGPMVSGGKITQEHPYNSCSFPVAVPGR